MIVKFGTISGFLVVSVACLLKLFRKVCLAVCSLNIQQWLALDQNCHNQLSVCHTRVKRLEFLIHRTQGKEKQRTVNQIVTKSYLSEPQKVVLHHSDCLGHKCRTPCTAFILCSWSKNTFKNGYSMPLLMNPVDGHQKDAKLYFSYGFWGGNAPLSSFSS